MDLSENQSGTAVLLKITELASRPEVFGHDIENHNDLVDNHGLNVYYNIKYLTKLCESIKDTRALELRDIADSENPIRAWLNNDNQAENFCFGCLAGIKDELHLKTREHQRSVQAQLFRLNATNKRALGYASWLYDNRFSCWQLLTDMAQTMLELSFWRLSGKIQSISSLSIPNVPDADTRLRNPVPSIRGTSNIGQPVALGFRLTIKNLDPDLTIVAYSCISHPYGYEFKDWGTVSYGTHHLEFQLGKGAIGDHYISIQVWLKVLMKTGQTKMVPIFCEVRWTWIDIKFEKKVLQHITVLNTKRIAEAGRDTTGVLVRTKGSMTSSFCPTSILNQINKGSTIRITECNWPKQLNHLTRQYLAPLNTDQLRVLGDICSGKRLTGCLGPPGTGKTYSIVKIVAALHIILPDTKFLIVTNTETSADILASKLIVTFFSLVPGSQFKALCRYNPPINPAIRLHGDESQPSYQDFSGVMGHNIIIMSCETMRGVMGDIREKTPFDLLLIDDVKTDFIFGSNVLELAQQTVVFLSEPDTSLAQVINEPDVFDPPLTNGPLSHGKTYRGCILLVINYRSRNEIVRLTPIRTHSAWIPVSVNNLKRTEKFSKHVDNSKGKLMKSIFRGRISNLTTQLFPTVGGSAVVFHHVEGIMQYPWHHTAGYYNSAELYVTEIVLNRLISSGVKPETIGIVTTFDAQAELLKALLGSQHYGLVIGTERDWEGIERDYIIASLVYSCVADGPEDAGRVTETFQFGVGMSRARLGMILVGNALKVASSLRFGALFMDICQKSSWLDDSTPESEANYLGMSIAIPYFLHFHICETWTSVGFWTDKTVLSNYFESVNKLQPFESLWNPVFCGHTNHRIPQLPGKLMWQPVLPKKPPTPPVRGALLRLSRRKIAA